MQLIRNYFCNFTPKFPKRDISFTVMSITKKYIYDSKYSNLTKRFDKGHMLFFFKWQYQMQDTLLLSPLYMYIRI